MSACLLFMIAVCLPVGDDPVFSGPQPGERLVPFTMTGVIGDAVDRKIDLVTAATTKPVVLVFVHERTRPAFGVANVVTRLVASRGADKVVGGLIYLTDDPTETANWMNRVSKYFPKKISVGISPDGKEGPGAYGLNRNVALTVVVAKAGKVTANFALVQPSLEADAPKIFKAIADVLGEKQVPKVEDYSRQPQNRAAMKRDGAAAQDPQIRPLLSPLIQKTATDDQVVAAAKKVEAYAAKNAKAKVQIGDIARRIIAAKKLENYGTKKCQEYLTKWAKEFLKETSKDVKPAPETKKD